MNVPIRFVVLIFGIIVCPPPSTLHSTHLFLTVDQFTLPSSIHPSRIWSNNISIQHSIQIPWFLRLSINLFPQKRKQYKHVFVPPCQRHVTNASPELGFERCITEYERS